MGKATPRFLFGQHPDQKIKGMNRGDQSQEVQAEELGGAEVIPASARPEPRPVLIQVVVRDEG